MPSTGESRYRCLGVFRPPKPEVSLALGVLTAVAWEWLVFSPAWEAGPIHFLFILPPSLAVCVALLFAWPRREELTAEWVAGLCVLLYLAFFAVHQSGGGPYDQDILDLYPRYGQSLLDTGELPDAEYPPGAIIAFAAARAIGPIDLSLPLLMLPLVVAAWYALARQHRQGPWLVACIALLPTLEPFWEIKYDAIPTALVVLGLVMGARRRWIAAGLLLGLGAGTKWYPGLAAVVLAAALLGTGDRAGLVRLLGAGALGFALVNLAFIGDWDALAYPYRFQSERAFIGESLPYLPLHFLGLANTPVAAPFNAEAPWWAKPADVLIIVATLVALTLAAYKRPSRALSLAAAAPVAFLLLNRVFSAQFLLPLAALWVTSLVLQPVSDVRERLFLGFLAVAAIANFAVWPLASTHWVALEVVFFVASIAATLVALGFPRSSSRLRDGHDAVAEHDQVQAAEERKAATSS
jgi:Glycosyltransferase family 87